MSRLETIKELPQVEKVVESNKYEVSWNGGGCNGMQSEEFDTLEAAEALSKRLSREMVNNDYVEKEDYPSVVKPFVVHYKDGSTLHDWEHISYGRDKYI